MAESYKDTVATNFGTKISTFIPLPGNSLPGIPQGFRIDKVLVSNNSGAAGRLGWGFTLAGLGVADYDGALLTSRTEDIAAGATIGNGGSIIIQSPTPIESIQLNVTAAGGAITAQQYWDGTQFKTFDAAGTEHVEYDTLATAVGRQFGVVVAPSDWARMEDETLIAQGFSRGMYVWKIDLAAPVTVDAVDGVKLVTVVEEVAAGQALTDCDDGFLLVPAGGRIVAYSETAAKENLISFRYSQTP